MRDVPLDELGEYDFYLPHTARLVLAGADPFNIAAYVRQVVRVDLGLSIFPEQGSSNSHRSALTNGVEWPCQQLDRRVLSQIGFL